MDRTTRRVVRPAPTGHAAGVAYGEEGAASSAAGWAHQRPDALLGDGPAPWAEMEDEMSTATHRA
jgi:hypothetical protein